MHNMLDISMVCFPYVVMGVGQAVIAGTAMTRRKTKKVNELQGRRITRLTFDTAASSAKGRILSGPPVLSPHWGKV